MSPAPGIGMFVERMALLASPMSTVRCIPPSYLGAKTGLDIQGAVPVCSSIMPGASNWRPLYARSVKLHWFLMHFFESHHWRYQ